MAIAEDASAPVAVHTTGTGSSVSASFSPPANSLLLAIACQMAATLSTTATVTVTDSGSHTWAKKAEQASLHSSGSNAGGTVSLYTTYLSSAPGSITVTAAFTNATGGGFLVVKVLTGASSTQNGATAAVEFGHTTLTTTCSTAITTTVTESIVYGCCNDSNSNDVFTANGSTTVIDTFSDTTDLDRAVAIKAAVTGTPGSVTLGGTWAANTNSNIALLEVLPSAAVAAKGRFLNQSVAVSSLR